MQKDIVVPIVFPDYRITVEIQKTKVDVFPWVDWDNFTIPKYKEKISNLGHAGVLFINGKTVWFQNSVGFHHNFILC